MDEEAPRNRKERRAAARQSGKPMEAPTTAPRMKMAQPDRSKPQSKTYMDLYEEKKALLVQGQPFDSKYEDGKVRDEGGNILEAGLADDDPIGPVGNAIFWSDCLAMVHFTLDVLVYSQYRQDIEWGEIFPRTFTIAPILFFLVYTLNTETANRFGLIRQVFFLLVGVVAGCYTIHVANRFGYYAVMKQCPPLGTLWIWSVIEMRLAFAAASVAINAGFMWFQGYSAF
jgi:hypothetical protein